MPPYTFICFYMLSFAFHTLFICFPTLSYTLFYAFKCFYVLFMHFHTLLICFHKHSNAKKQNVPSPSTYTNVWLSRCAAGKKTLDAFIHFHTLSCAFDMLLYTFKRKKAKRPRPLLRHLHHPKAQPLRGWQKSIWVRAQKLKKKPLVIIQKISSKLKSAASTNL